MAFTVVIDIDGTITPLACLRRKKKQNGDLTANHPHFFYNIKVIQKLVDFGLAFYSKRAFVRSNASVAIHKLKQYGCRIVIYNRRYISEKTCLNTEIFLEKRDIPYDEIIYLGMEGNKAETLKELDPDLVIDDNPTDIEDIKEAGFKITCFRHKKNKMIEADHEQIFVAENWLDVPDIYLEITKQEPEIKPTSLPNKLNLIPRIRSPFVR